MSRGPSTAFKAYSVVTCVLALLAAVPCVPLFLGLFDGGWGSLGIVFVFPIAAALFVPALAAMAVWRGRVERLASITAIVSVVIGSVFVLPLFGNNTGLDLLALLALTQAVLTIVMCARELRHPR